MIRLKRTKSGRWVILSWIKTLQKKKHKVNNPLQYLGGLRRGEVKPGRNKVMLRHLGPVSPVSGWRHQTSWPELTLQATNITSLQSTNTITLMQTYLKVSKKWILKWSILSYCDKYKKGRTIWLDHCCLLITVIVNVTAVFPTDLNFVW